MAKKKEGIGDVKMGVKEHYYRGRISFGVVLLIIGVIWLLRELGYLTNIPIWPTILIVIALWLIFKKSWKCC